MRSRPLLFALVMLLFAGACSRPYAPLPSLDDPALKLTSPYDSLGIEAFLALDVDRQAARRRATDKILAEVVHHEQNRGLWVLAETRRWRGSDAIDITIRDPERRYDHLVRLLNQAVGLDPTHAGAWFKLGAYTKDIGDLEAARRAFAMVAQAVPNDPSVVQPESVLLEAAKQQAWCCRGLGYRDEGLSLMDEIRSTNGLRDLEAKIVYGLLLADAGRFQEAYNLSMSIGPVEIPDIGMFTSGLNTIRTDYVRCWIQAMAWIGIGEPKMARHVLRGFHLSDKLIPYEQEYWSDFGLVCELGNEVEDSRLAYAFGVRVKKPLLPFVNWDAFSTQPVILEQPHILVTCFTAYETRLLGGSLFTLGAQLLTECAQAKDDVARLVRGAKAVNTLSTCIRRNIRPVLALALRGRARYYMGDFAAAETDLRSAGGQLRSEGRGDAGTELVLGTVLVQDQRCDEAVEYLNGAIELDPTMAGAWRTLGVAHATLGNHDEAEEAFDRALELDPESSLGWHNRGIYHASREHWVQAMTDLGVAVRLAPWNEEALDLLQTVTLEMRDAELGEAALGATVRADSLAGSIALYTEGRLEQSPGVITLNQPSERVSIMAELSDFAAVADSLAVRYAATPTIELRSQLAEACLRAGRSDDVLALLGDVPREETTSDDTVLLLRVDRGKGDPDRALALVEDIGGPRDLADADMWSLAALICMDHGFQDEGMKALTRALELDPDNRGLQAYRQFLLSRRSQ